MNTAESAVVDKSTILDRPIAAEDLEPNDDRVVLRRIVITKHGRLELATPEKSMFARVLAVGPGKLLDDGTRAKMRSAVGQTILLPYGVQEIKLGDDVIIILREVDITAHVNPKAVKPVSQPSAS